MYAAASSDLVQRAVAQLHTSCWEQVQDLAMVRLVSSDRAGPLAKYPPSASSGNNPGPDHANLCFDVGFAVTDGAIRLTQQLLNTLAVAPEEIWAVALDNTQRWLQADVGHSAIGPVRIHFLSGGLFTTGMLATDSQVLQRLGIDDAAPGQEPRRRISALNATTVAIFDPLDANPHPDARSDNRLGWILGNHLAALFPDRMPPNLFHRAATSPADVKAPGSFPWFRILE